MKDLDRIRFVTRHFHDLRGLLQVPTGIFLMAGGAESLVHSRLLGWLLIFIMISAPLGVFFLSSRYYERTFGHVERLPRDLPLQPDPLSIYSSAGTTLRLARQPVSHEWLRGGLVAALVLVLFSALRAINPAVTVTVRWGNVTEPRWMPFLVQAMYFLFGIAFLITWLHRERRLSQAYYLVFAVLMLALAALGSTEGLVFPILLNQGTGRAATMILVLLLHNISVPQVLYGAAIILVGLLDHFQLVRRPTLAQG